MEPSASDFLVDCYKKRLLSYSPFTPFSSIVILISVFIKFEDLAVNLNYKNCLNSEKNH